MQAASVCTAAGHPTREEVNHACVAEFLDPGPLEERSGEAWGEDLYEVA